MADTCRSCGAPVQWAKTKNGKAMPLDAEPTTEGNVLLRPDGSMAVLTKDDLEEARLTNAPLHLSHFVTCPDGPTWKRS